MTFVAVLSDDQASLEILDCHLNLWCLGALGARRTFVLDIGLRLRAVKQVKAVRLAVPFGTADHLVDLTDHVLNAKTAELIFDTEVETVTGRNLTVRGEQWSIVRPATKLAKRDDAYSSKDFSVWDIPLADKIAAGREGYVRFRFEVSGTGRTWKWEKHLFTRTGALLDLRINDLRATSSVPGGEELSLKFQPINRVAAFVMIPSWLHQRSTNPDPSYVRLLEPKVWRSYLGRAPELLPASRLVVYSWKSKKRSETLSDGRIVPVPGVTKANPMRVFGDFGVERRPLLWLNALVTSLLTLSFIAAIFQMQPGVWLVDLVTGAGKWIASLPPLLSIGAIVAFVFASITRYIPGLRKIYFGLRGFARRLEAFLFRKLS